jgi:hypothetical protein
MQALDSLTSPFPGFEGDIPILAIPVSTWSPSNESANDLSGGYSAGAWKTQSGKRKAAATPTPQKKAAGKSTSGIRIKEPTPKASSTLTPPSGSQKKILICLSNKYARLWLPAIFEHLLTYASLHRVPWDINPDSSAQDVWASGESPKVDKPPTPNTEKTAPKPTQPLSPGGAQSSSSASGALSPSAKAGPSPNSIGASPGLKPAKSSKTSPPSPQAFGLGCHTRF